MKLNQSEMPLDLEVRNLTAEEVEAELLKILEKQRDPKSVFATALKEAFQNLGGDYQKQNSLYLELSPKAKEMARTVSSKRFPQQGIETDSF